MKMGKGYSHKVAVKLDGVEYESIADAARKLGFDTHRLSRAIKEGKRYLRWVERIEHSKLIEVVKDE